MFPPEALPQGLLTLEQAIARMEGWYARGTVRNHTSTPMTRSIAYWMLLASILQRCDML